MGVPLTRDFFKLEGDCKELDENSFITLLDSCRATHKNILYKPDILENPHKSGRFRVKDKKFVNVSFSHTVITGFDFTDCTFERCLFIGTIFKDCRFTSGEFIDSNPHRIEFKDCFVDPTSFEDCIDDHNFSNIGVYLFQELLRNSRQQAQPDFSDEALYRFKKWERHLLWQDILHSGLSIKKICLTIDLGRLHIFNLFTGSGMRLGRLAISSFLLLLLFTLINLFLAVPMGLGPKENFNGSFVDAFYFSTVVTTTLGFGDISPSTPLGRIIISFEAVAGFVIFALLTSTMYRKFTS
jgi:hypothetical protein